jgi:hypothetical protein
MLNSTVSNFMDPVQAGSASLQDPDPDPTKAQDVKLWQMIAK